MRMWLGVEPREMCSQHLLGEHNELHMLKGNLDNENFNLIEGHEKKGQVDISRLYQRHEKLEMEMRDRDMSVNSPIKQMNPKHVLQDRNKELSCSLNRRDLFNRCKKCRRNRNYWNDLKAFFWDAYRLDRSRLRGLFERALTGLF